MKLGSWTRASQDLHTHLNRTRDLTGNLERMSMSISVGIWNDAVSILRDFLLGFLPIGKRVYRFFGYLQQVAKVDRSGNKTSRAAEMREREREYEAEAAK